VPLRVYLDVVPAFTQTGDAQRIDVGSEGQTDYHSEGQSIGPPGCSIRTGGRDWVPTWQPVVLEQWPVTRAAPAHGITTVANWRGYGSIEFDGVKYGQKVHSWRQFVTLPTKSTERFDVALAVDAAETRDRAALRAKGWHVVDPLRVAGSPAAYRTFVSRSKAELGIAKSGYVRSRCGWFSDRSICYLASGRPVIAQDTGFAERLPVGAGLLAFTDLDDIVRAVDAVNRDYENHRRAARQIAERHFDSDLVLNRLLEAVGAR